jgi:hypothetical protein
MRGPGFAPVCALNGAADGEGRGGHWEGGWKLGAVVRGEL